MSPVRLGEGFAVAPVQQADNSDTHDLNIKFQIQEPKFESNDELLRRVLEELVFLRQQLMTTPPPTVNVPAPIVDVAAPDLGELTVALTALLDNDTVPTAEAIGAAVARSIPSQTVDVSKLTKALTTLDKKLETLDFRLKAGNSGGGGGPSNEPVVAAINQQFATKVTVSGSITYIGKAAPGSAQSAAVWQCQKIDETTGTVITWANGNALFSNIATNLTTLTYV